MFPCRISARVSAPGAKSATSAAKTWRNRPVFPSPSWPLWKTTACCPHKVARALGVRLGTFMDDQVTREPVVTRASEHTGDLTIGRARDADPALRYTALARGKSDRAMEPFFMEVEPGAAEQTSSHQGEEFLYVLEGAARLEYGRQSHILRAGDSIYYNSVVPHAVRAEGGPARLLAVVYFPA